MDAIRQGCERTTRLRQETAPRIRAAAACLLAAGMVWAMAYSTRAQDLTWGIDGAGGSGAWDDTTSNWWNGVSNQAWTNGATARFTGAPGTVTVTGAPSVAAMEFDANMTLTGGTLQASTAGLVVSNAADVVITSTIAGAEFVKAGAGTLELAGTNTYAGRTLVEAGILAIDEDANLGAGDRVELNTGHLDIRRDLVSGKTVATDNNRLRLNGHQVEFWALEGNANVFSVTNDHLTVTSGAFDYISWQLGKLTIPNADGGRIVLNYGWDVVLEANGSLDQIDAGPGGGPPTIELGPEFAQLSVGTYFAFGYNLLHLKVGPAECDHIEVRDHFNFNSANDDMQLRFEDVGGLVLEQPYRIMSFPPGQTVDLDGFRVDQYQGFVGWDVSLNLVSNELFATFHALGGDIDSHTPTNLRLVGADRYHLTFAWDDNTDRETGYRLLLDNDSRFLYEIPANTTHFQTPKLPGLFSIGGYGLWAVNDQGQSKHIAREGFPIPRNLTAWRNLLFTEENGGTVHSGAGDDPDGDGLANQLECWLGTSPFLGDEGRGPRARILEDPSGYRYLGFTLVHPALPLTAGDIQVRREKTGGRLVEYEWSTLSGPTVYREDEDLGDGWIRAFRGVRAPDQSTSPDMAWYRIGFFGSSGGGGRGITAGE